MSGKVQTPAADVHVVGPESRMLDIKTVSTAMHAKEYGLSLHHLLLRQRPRDALDVDSFPVVVDIVLVL
jgi:hypothetical protein